MDERRAYEVLKLEYGATPDKIKTAYRKMALKLHPDRNGSSAEFEQVTKAYELLKSKPIPTKSVKKHSTQSQQRTAKPDPPEQDWSKYTKEYEQNQSFWTEYERKFWKNYGKFTDKSKDDARTQDESGEKKRPDLAIKVEPSLCIGCCSCEVIAPDVFSIDKVKQTNPKSTVINRHGASFEKIMNAAETCPTKAISVGNIATGEKLYPF